MAPTHAFCGISPDRMRQMALSLRGAADGLTTFSQEFEYKLSRHELGTTALKEIAEIAEWGRAQVSMLDGRADLIETLNAGGAPASQPDGGPGLLRLPDELEGFETAQALARSYGQDIFVRFNGEFQAALIHDHIDDIRDLAKNPQAAAAFYALLPPGVRDSLPGLIAATGSKTAKEDLTAFSEALGAALRAPTLIPAFAKVRTDLVRPAGDKAAAWNRLALLKGANAPTNLRSAAARILALDDFAKNPRQDWRAAGPAEVRAYGLPSDLAALSLEVLTGDGTAVRHAFSEMGRPEVTLTQPEKMKLFLDYAKTSGTGHEVATAFGHAAESGTEATTEKPGQHSPAAAAFTLDVIKTTGPFGDNLPAPARASMATIAKSYIHELASGARFDKAVDRASGLKPPESWTPFPGVTPAFFLSPGDTYRFLRTFVGEKRLTDDLDTVAVQFRHDTLTSAARLDAQGSGRNFEDTTRMFGDLASLEFMATLDVRGERDATDDVIREFTKNTLSLGIDQAPFGKGALGAGWEVIKAYFVSGLLDNWADSFETRVEEATGARSDLVLRQKYDLAHILYEADYPTSDPPAELISESTGRLKTYDELLVEAKRESSNGTWEQALRTKLTPYERWMDKNGALDNKVEDSSRFYASDHAKEQMNRWD